MRGAIFIFVIVATAGTPPARASLHHSDCEIAPLGAEAAQTFGYWAAGRPCPDEFDMVTPTLNSLRDDREIGAARVKAPNVKAEFTSELKLRPPREAQDAPATAVGSDSQAIDRIAVRIGGDVITESEVRELAAFQRLVDGEAKPRDEVIRELADQWIARGEAETAKYPEPSPQDIDRAYAQLKKQFPSPEEFARRSAAAGLTESAIRRQLGLQLYLSRFLDYRFRPEVNVDDAAIQKYYDEEFVAQLKARGETAPPLADVRDTIREVLVQRAIDDRAKQWLDDTRSGLAIDVLPEGSGP